MEWLARLRSASGLDMERASALVAWALVAGSTLYLLLLRDVEATHWRFVTAALLYLAYLAFFLLVTRDQPLPADHRLRPGLLLLLFAIVVAVYLVVPYSTNAILMVMWCAALPYFVPMRTALWLSPLTALPLWLVYHFYWRQDGAHITALLFWSFNLFAMVTMNTSLRERQAREAANQLNRELLATQELLGEAGRQAERLRIARNIHDLVGHHLTALSINLQVAARRSEGEVREQVERCHAIAGLLLSDVREAVSDIRERSAIDLETALETLTREVPRLDVSLDCRAEVRDVDQARAILLCVQESLTNSLKHSAADRFHIQLDRDRGDLYLHLEDNGAGSGSFHPGNGLSGIRERIEMLGGTVAFRLTDKGFATRVQLPGEAA